ncbi:hypothetical protein [Haloplanus natans]|uniref:hypothetical protein n=1 Tax=Haloplanus natans TaxID=376171 RepID=UPI0006775A70|nr:hypothetical protein [Haloplanus natans]
MTLDEIRAAAIDRALVGDDPGPALALAGAVDGVARRDASSGPRTATPLAAAMLTVTYLSAERGRPLDDRAWHPGRVTDPLVVAGAAAAVRTRNVAVDRAAELADCATTTLDAAVNRQRRREKER